MASSSVQKRVLYLISPREAGWFESEKSQQLKAFRDAVAMSASFDFFVSSVDNILIEIIDGDVRVTDLYNNLDLREYDIIHVRNVNPLARDFIAAITNYITYHEGEVYEKADVPAFGAGKASQMVAFALAGLGVPDTIASYRSEHLPERIGKLGYPFILKDDDGTKGQTNFLIHDHQDLDGILTQYHDVTFIAQRFIPNEGDYRVLYTGTNEPLIFKRTAKAGSHLNNTSQGASGSRILSDQLPANALHLAQQAKEIAGRDIAGVDLVNEKDTEKWYLFEINLHPALATGEFLNEKTTKYVNVINAILEKGV